jgi:hypothetical protein
MANEVHVPGRLDVIDMQNIWMIQRRSGFGFLHKTPFPLWISGFLRRQHFERDEAVEAGIAGLVHDAHPTFAKFRVDPVVADRPADHRSHLMRRSWASQSSTPVDARHPRARQLPSVTQRSPVSVSRCVAELMRKAQHRQL